MLKPLLQQLKKKIQLKAIEDFDVYLTWQRHRLRILLSMPIEIPLTRTPLRNKKNITLR